MNAKVRWSQVALFASLGAVGCGGGGGAALDPPAPAVLTMYNSSANFGDVAVGATRVLAVNFANTGGLPLTLQQNSLSGAGFSASGVGSGVTLGPGQYATLTVSFNPPATGQSSGSVSLGSTTSAAPIGIPLSGNGIIPSHLAALNWNPSTSTVVGYNIYRNSIVDGSWVRINSEPVATAMFSDWDVRSGVFYLYSVKAVSTSNVESAFSESTSASIP